MSFGYTTIKNLMEQLQDIRGKEVGYGYFRHTERDIKENELCIDVLDILEYLESEEITTGVAWDKEEECDFEYPIADYIELGLEEGWIEEIESGYTYNYCSPLNHNIAYEIYYDNEKYDYLVKMCVHMFGDARTGFSEDVYLQFDNRDDFFEIINEVRKYVEIELDNEKYYIEISPLSDYITLEKITDDGDYEEIWDNEEKGEILNKMEELGIITW